MGVGCGGSGREKKGSGNFTNLFSLSSVATHGTASPPTRDCSSWGRGRDGTGVVVKSEREAYQGLSLRLLSGVSRGGASSCARLVSFFPPGHRRVV